MAADLGLAPKKKPISLPQRTGPMDTTPVPYGPQASGNTLLPMRNAPLRVPTGGPTGYRSQFDLTPQGPQAPVFPVAQQANVLTGPAAVAAHTSASIPGVPGPQLPPIPPTAPAKYASQVQQHGLMDNRGAELFQRDTGYMPNRTVGGAYGPPQGQLPFEQKRPINLGNALFQGAQPGTVAGKPAWVDGPEAGPFPSQKSTAISNETTATREAKSLFDARRGGPAARRTAYEGRTAAAATERSTNRKTREMAKADARRVRMGDMTFEERLAASDPQAAQQTKIAKSQFDAQQLGLAKQREFLGSEGDKNRQNRLDVGKLQIQSAQAKNEPVLTPIQKQQQQEQAATGARTKQELEEKIKELPPGTQNAIRQQWDQDNAPTAGQNFINSPLAGALTGETVPMLDNPYVNPFAAGAALGRLAPQIGLGYRAPPPVRAGRFGKKPAPAK